MNRCRMKKAAKPLEPLPVRAARMLARLKHVRGLTDAEKSVYLMNTVNSLPAITVALQTKHTAGLS
jgi:hypothetical protein